MTDALKLVGTEGCFGVRRSALNYTRALGEFANG